MPSTHGICITTTRYGNEGHTHASTLRVSILLLLRTSTTYYFMAAGTKPPQPPVRYCPHSAGGAQLVEASEQELDEVEVDDDQLLV